MTQRHIEDADTIIDALAYVTALYREFTEENGAPLPGTQNQAVDFILGDPELTEYVRSWAARQHSDDPVPAPPERLPCDEVWRRVAERLGPALGEPIFRQTQHNPP